MQLSSQRLAIVAKGSVLVAWGANSMGSCGRLRAVVDSFMQFVAASSSCHREYNCNSFKQMCRSFGAQNWVNVNTFMQLLIASGSC